MFTGVEKRQKGEDFYGLFATTDIPAGTIIVPKWHEDFYLEMDGWRFVDTEEMVRLPRAQRQLFFRYGLDVDFQRIVGPVSQQNVVTLDNFINHSCEPNLIYDHLGNVITRWAARKGDELTIDYGCFTVNFDEDFDCRCGSVSCRGRVRKDDWRMLARRYGLAMPRFLHPYIGNQQSDSELA